VLCGPSISHPSLTISFLGFGRISHETLRRLLAFTSKSQPPTILYHSSRARPNQAEIDEGYTRDFGVQVRRVEIEELAEKGDVVVVLCSLTKETTDLVGKEFLGRMKKSAVLVNAARVSRGRRATLRVSC
jgi:glyoxylate/hydroxypyruvate reductase